MMNLLRRLIFSLWYYFKPPWDTGVSPPELLEYIRAHAPGRALDLGCGTGTNVITLAQYGWDVTGVDFAPSAIWRARKKARAAAVQADLQVGDVTHLEGVNGPFDLVLDMGCYHSLTAEGRQDYAKTLDRLLSPGGNYLLYVFFREDGGSGPGVEENELENLFPRFELAHRQNGTERGIRPSAWITYQKPP